MGRNMEMQQKKLNIVEKEGNQNQREYTKETEKEKGSGNWERWE